MAPEKSSPVPAQDDLLVPGKCLSQGSWLYKVHCLLDEGSFGKVAKCTRTNDGRTVAIKMIKSDVKITQARHEVSALLKLRSLGLDHCNIVQWYRAFMLRGYVFLEFEYLDQSLYRFMKHQYFKPLLLQEIRPILQQLANALGYLSAAGIIHADIKLENVMLVNQVRQPYRVKLIDFGLAHEESKIVVGSKIQTLPYRSPEILLGLPYTAAIDMWSLGCLAAVMYLGTLLFSGSDGYTVMKNIVETQGQPPDFMLKSGLKTDKYFQRDITCWKLKTPEQIQSGEQTPPPRRRKSLDQIGYIWLSRGECTAKNNPKITDMLSFVEMLKGMLQLDAAVRMTPDQVLEHPFISMSHIAHKCCSSNYVSSCFNFMATCQNYVPSFNYIKAGRDRQPPRSARGKSCTTQASCRKPPPCAYAPTATSKLCVSLEDAKRHPRTTQMGRLPAHPQHGARPSYRAETRVQAGSKLKSAYNKTVEPEEARVPMSDKATRGFSSSTSKSSSSHSSRKQNRVPSGVEMKTNNVHPQQESCYKSEYVRRSARRCTVCRDTASRV